jgi:sugar O-acyltransferase (sialic acid O-acetyltransferase NeuD family)
MSNIVLVGYSGHSYIVAEILLLHRSIIAGYVDTEPKPKNPFRLDYLGSEADDLVIEKMRKMNALYALGLGDNRLRKRVDAYFKRATLTATTPIHPNSIVSSHAKIDEGVMIAAGAVINPFAFVGRASIINTQAVVEHECLLGDYVHIAPGAVLAGNVEVGDCAFIGANATIKQGVKIGANATIGAGSVVLQDVPDNEVWVGVPAKQIR